MNICYFCNDYYVPQTGISTISVCENNRAVEELVFYLVSKDISTNNIDILNSIFQSYDREIL